MTIKAPTRTSRSKIANGAWATCAITLGVWESVALTTKRVPTISTACRCAKSKYRRPTEAIVGVWLIGLGAHLLKDADEH